MRSLYNIGIRSYGFGVIVAGLLGSSKAIKWVEGRRKWQRSLAETKWNQPIWVHASSLGEFEQARPLIERIKSDPLHKETQIIVTFFSPSGYEHCKNYDLADGVFYLPLDTKKNAKAFLDSVRPRLAVFVKYDFWFNFLSALQDRKIPTLYFSSNFRENQWFFKKTSSWQRGIMRKIDFIYCLNATSENVLRNYKFTNVGVCGDTRFDRVLDNANRVTPYPLVEAFSSGSKVLVLGSSWPTEEEIVQDYVNNHFSDELKIIIAPHDISEEHLEAIENRFERGLIRYSRATVETIASHKILLIDNIGMLSNLYQYGDIALIGGGFSNGLHNILEACAFGNVLMYGNVISKYPEGLELNQMGGSMMLKDARDFVIHLNELLSDHAKRIEMQNVCKSFVEKHKGATSKVYEKVKELLN